MKRKRFSAYSITLAAVLIACAYPMYMGIATLISFLKNGYVEALIYPRYVIPYAPLAAALIASVALLPLFMKRFKKRALLPLSLLGIAVFFACEIGLERMQVAEGAAALPLGAWQYSLCVATPEVLRAIGDPLYAPNNPAFKLHFYFIALVILLAVLQTAHAFVKMEKEKDYTKKKPLVLQLAAVVSFVGLCVLACFTAFFRNGTIEVSPLSAFLMIVFFLLFGVTFGTYLGCLFYGRRGWVSVLLPAAAAMAATLLMYLGELVLLDGKLFRFGQNFLFDPPAGFPFAPADVLVVLLSGIITWLLLRLVNRKPLSPC